MMLCAVFASILAVACVNPDGTTQPLTTIPGSTLEVSVTTTGSDPDQNGYFLVGDRSTDSEGSSLAASLPVNGTVIVSGLAADTYSKIRLAGLAPNCDLVTALPKNLLGTSGVTKLSISIQCGDPSQLTYVLGEGDANSLSIGQFWMIDVTGRNATRLTTDNASHETPAWSPDGSRLAFVSNRGGRAGIWIMEENGDVVALNAGLQESFGPRWSPDGHRLVFFSPVEGMTQLFSVKADGTDLRAITSGPPGDYDPDWSPDGKKIVFASTRDGIPGIWIVNTDGTAPVRLTSRRDTNPTWSPDGSTIAFSRFEFSRYNLYTMTAHGSAPTSFNIGAISARPAWSSNGRKIAFTTSLCMQADACQAYIQFVGIDGTSYTSITLPGFSGDVAWRQRR
jgi:Tol biopolymer transport system component